MNAESRPVAFWIITVFLLFDLVNYLVGQTASLFAYDFTVSIGLQESEQAIGAYGVQVNRSFGLADTLVGVPLMVLSLIGLILRKPWALATLAAFMGMTLYWHVCSIGLLIFLKGVEGFNFEAPVSYWLLFVIHILFGVWVLFYIGLRWQNLVRRKVTISQADQVAADPT